MTNTDTKIKDARSAAWCEGGAASSYLEPDSLFEVELSPDPEVDEPLPLLLPDPDELPDPL